MIATGISGLLLAQDGLAKMWLMQDPSSIGVALAGVLALGGVIVVLVLLRKGDDELMLTDVPDELQREVLSIRRARRVLLDQLASAPAALRGALTPLLQGPLTDYDQRVEALVAAACEQGEATASAHTLDQEQGRLRRELEVEEDPRARTLLTASLRDLETTRRVRGDLARNGRLARLELNRLRMLLESLPARIRELASRESLGRGEDWGVEAIAQQLELAVRGTEEVLGDRPESPLCVARSLEMQTLRQSHAP